MSKDNIFSCSLHSKSFLVFTGIPECFAGNYFDDERDVWNDSVTEMLFAIPNVTEVSCYGEYSVTLEFDVDEEAPTDPATYVQNYIDKWIPPFDLEDIVEKDWHPTKKSNWQSLF
jgi:hypothetical protein